MQRKTGKWSFSHEYGDPHNPSLCFASSKKEEDQCFRDEIQKALEKNYYRLRDLYDSMAQM